MLNKYKITSVNIKNVCYDKEYKLNYDLATLIRLLDSKNNMLIDRTIEIKQLRKENRILKQKIKELEFRGLIS